MIHYSSFAAHKKMYGPTDSGCSQISTVRTEDEPPDQYTVKKKVFIDGIRGDPFGYQRAT